MVSPVLVSHRATVSRCTLNATPTTAGATSSVTQSRTERVMLAQISPALCSTQPGLGCTWPNATLAVRNTAPRLSTSIALVELVPWSIARMKLLGAAIADHTTGRVGDAVGVEVEIIQQERRVPGGSKPRHPKDAHPGGI